MERADGVVTVTLNRPAMKNAINGVMWLELAEVLRQIDDSADDRCVVITGAGGAFCSGQDLSAVGGRRRHYLPSMDDVSKVASSLHRLRQPVIAKVTGVAAGAGANLALGCDLIVASPSARFCEIFARRGLSIDFGGSWLLPRLVGMHKAKELALLADMVSADEAMAIGLVNRVVAEDEIDAFVDGWASRLAAGPPIALAQTKRMLSSSFETGFEQALDNEASAQSVNFGTKDTAEAISAFLDKRDPTFRGH